MNSVRHDLWSDLTLREIAAKKLHHGQKSFINPFNGHPLPGLGKVLIWKLFSRNRFKHLYFEEPRRTVRPDWPAITAGSGLSVTFLRHASILIKDRSKVLLVDPVLGGIVPGMKDFSPLDRRSGDFPQPDHILITHGHFDHLDEKSLRRFAPDTHLISPLGYEGLFQRWRMPRFTSLDWFDSFEDDGLTVTLVPANHWTRRGPCFGPNRGLWGSYVIRTASGPTLFVSGDTAYFHRFKEIGRLFRIDLAVFNLGAYEPRWIMRDNHMNPEETARAFADLGAKKLMIVHWGTFRLGDEPVHLPPLELEKELKKQGMLDQWVFLNHGETLDWDLD